MSYRGKVILLGDPGVGKTSLLSVYTINEFKEEYIQTTGANFLIKEIDLRNIIYKIDIETPKLLDDIKNKGFKLYFWDIGGQHDKLFANEYYFIYALGAMIVFDIVDRESFNNLDFWISKMKELSGEIPFILIGNKIDLEDNRVINVKEIEKKANDIGVNYFETSAKLNKNVDKAFESLSVQILKKFK